MNTKTTLSITEARKKIFQIVAEIQKPGVYYTITEKGQPKAVIMSAEEFESWMETMEVMKDFPDLDKDIEEAKRAVKSGEYKNWTTLDELLNEYGYILADKGKNDYDASIKNRPSGKKTTRKNSKNLSR